MAQYLFKLINLDICHYIEYSIWLYFFSLKNADMQKHTYSRTKYQHTQD